MTEQTLLDQIRMLKEAVDEHLSTIEGLHQMLDEAERRDVKQLHGLSQYGLALVYYGEQPLEEANQLWRNQVSPGFLKDMSATLHDLQKTPMPSVLKQAFRISMAKATSVTPFWKRPERFQIFIGDHAAL